ncbi:MAG: D-glycero-beta-D-manno-heptose 1-phosphate adenylyltransferase [Armatimonadetes bacterium]|nr:D-glycero-beta-D-manno-heptose 1-phosphate adenylyltransferase [Armatimonadota bacterium]
MTYEPTGAGAHTKVVSRTELAERLSLARTAGKRVVMTNGCFDILHVGHARYLAEARAQGDLLVVGLNSDASVAALKGPQRPLIPECERADMLAHLEAVDLVSIFDEATAIALAEVVRPDVYVKGGDRQGQTIPEAATVEKHGGCVYIASLIAQRSTTNVIERVLQSYAASSAG